MKFIITVTAALTIAFASLATDAMIWDSIMIGKVEIVKPFLKN